MPQRFTLEEAEALLPRLIPLVAQMQELKQKYDSIIESLGATDARVQTNGNPAAHGGEASRQALESVTGELNSVVEEISSHGCEVKDLSLGLLDFRSLRDGREVYLCWKAGEPRIEWWHHLDTGFASRQPISREQD
jgi:hypothetical protein